MAWVAQMLEAHRPGLAGGSPGTPPIPPAVGVGRPWPECTSASHRPPPRSANGRPTVIRPGAVVLVDRPGGQARRDTTADIRWGLVTAAIRWPPTTQGGRENTGVATLDLGGDPCGDIDGALHGPGHDRHGVEAKVAHSSPRDERLANQGDVTTT